MEKNIFKVALLSISFILMCHIPYAFKGLTIEMFDKFIAGSLFFASWSGLSMARELSHYKKRYNRLRFVFIWALTGSASNLLDEMLGINTRHISYETIVFIVLFLIFLKREKTLISDGR